jgi:excisionase family DNA binding protein
MTLDEAAAFLKSERHTIVRWINDGVIPSGCYKRPGHRYIFSRRALQDWLEEGEATDD